MPEQEIRTEDPTSWPRGELQILDFTGTPLAEKFDLDLETGIEENIDALDEPFYQHLSKYKVLQVEQTMSYLRIVENETDEYLFPVYSPPGSSIDERHLAAAERHQPVLGHYHRMEQGSVESCIEVWRRQCANTIRFLKTHRTKITRAQKDSIRFFVEAAVRDITYFFAYVHSKPGCDGVPTGIKNLLPRLVNDLESDIRKWLDDEGPFPTYLSGSTMEELWSIFGIRIDDEDEPFYAPAVESMAEAAAPPKKYFDVQGIFSLEPLEDYISSDAYGRRPESKGGKLEFQTKNFTLSKGFYSKYFKIFKNSEGEDNSYNLRSIWKENHNEHFQETCFLLEHDMLLSYSISRHVEGQDESIHLVDLHKVHEITDEAYEGQVATMFAEFTTTKLLACRSVRYGMVLLHNPNDLLQVSLYLADIRDPKKQPFYSSCCFDIPNPVLVSCIPNHLKAFLPRSRTSLYLSCSLTIIPRGATWGFWLCLMKRNPKTENLHLQHQQEITLEGIEGLRFEVVTLEAKNNRVFACAFTPDCRLWAFMYWRGRFVCAGRQRGGFSTPFDLGNKFSELHKVDTLGGPLAVAGHRKPDPHQVGPQVHRFTLITLDW